MMEKSYLIEQFIDNFKGFSCITSIKSSQVLFSNDSYKVMCHHTFSLSEAISSAESLLEEKCMTFCDFVEIQFRKTLEPTFAIELFNGIEYSTIRTLIEYKKELCILTLIIICSENPSIEPMNDIHICNINKYNR
ncbi:hypothetical protein [Aliivibrio wodanis]|uniref:hypothetical protein n=1 Tax=Aliivibrio wodanis TaxID=80852 RepID=UPI00406C157C